MALSVFSPDRADVIDLLAQRPAASAGISSRTLLKTAGGKAVLFSFDAGQELTEHTNPNHALLHALDGTIQLTLDGRSEAVRPGQMVHLPPQLPHAVRADEPCTFLLTLLTP